VATTTHRGAPAFEIRDGVRVHRLGGVTSRLAGAYKSDRRFHPTAPDPGIVRGLARIAASERADIVHAHSWIVYSFLPLKRRSGARLVVTLHDYSLICAKKTYLRGTALCDGPAYAKCVGCASDQYGIVKSAALVTGLQLSGLLHARVDHYVAASRAVRDEMARVMHPSAPMEVLPSFVADGAAEAAARAPRPPFLPDGDFVLFVGALGRHKGLDVLLEAWRSLQAPPPLVLIGTAQPDTPERFPDGVTVVQEASHGDVMAAWARALFGVVPSRSEGGGPIVLIEALACGRPVVASAVGGAPDLVVDGENGILVPPGDGVALRAGLRALLDDPALRARMAEAARLGVPALSLSAATDRMERVYRQTLADADAAMGGRG
jgi:glycosyltransferase involved in cell wall biosynthesis